MNAKEMIAEVILEVRQYLCNTEFAPEPFTEPVDINVLKVKFPEAILNLRYDCDLCDGTGSKDYGEGDTDCKDCNGTGKGGRMLAVLDEDGTIQESKIEC